MKKNKTIILGVCAVALVVIVAVLLIAFLQDAPESDYEMKISEAEKYMLAGDYDKAIIAYKAAISLDRSAEDAYLGLHRAYLRTGRDNMAAEILRQGYDRTGSDSIREKLEESGEIVETTPSPTQSDDSERGDTLLLNEAMLNFFSSADFSDYKSKYSTNCNVSGDTCTVTVSELGATLTFRDSDSARVINREKGEPYAGSVPASIVLSEVMSLFGGIGSADYYGLQQIRAISSLQKSNGKITFNACGCNLTIECDGEGVFRSGAGHTIVPSGTSVGEETVTYELSGRVFDAYSGEALAGVTVTAYTAGGNHAATSTTSSNGAYWLMMDESGEYTIQLQKSGYVTASYSLRFDEGETTKIKDYTLEIYVEPTTEAPTTEEPTTEEPTAAPCEIKGKVVDATNGNAVEGVELTIYPDGNSFDKQYTTTGSDGAYSFVVDAGQTYTVETYKEGYISESTSITLGDNDTILEKDLTISPEMRSGEIRIVLTWGEKPSDLDSYLTGTSSDGTYVNCNFTNKYARDSSGNEIVNLDVDDTSGYGPETTTLSDVNGVYNFYVDDYTNSGTMGALGEATVKIYSDGALLHTLTIPASAVDRWDVCTIDHGVIQIINSGS